MKTKDLFNASGCLKLGTIALYQEGRLDDAGKTRVEKHLADCPLCREAVEGYGILGDSRHHRRIALELKKRFFQSVFSRKEPGYGISAMMASEAYVPPRERFRHRHDPSRNWKVRNWPYYVAVVASLLLIAGYFSLFEDRKPQSTMAENLAEPDTFRVADEDLRVTETRVPEEAPALPVKEEMTDRKKSTQAVVSSRKEIASGPEIAESKVIRDGISTDSVTPDEGIHVAGILADEKPESEEKDAVAGAAREEAQATGEALSMKRTTAKSAVAEETAPAPQVMPEFRHKDYRDFNDYIEKNMKYPAHAKESGLEGTVWVEFVVNRRGNVEKVEIARGVNPDLDAEAKRLIGNSPPWIPGTLNNRAVDTKLELPVVFKMEE